MTAYTVAGNVVAATQQMQLIGFHKLSPWCSLWQSDDESTSSSGSSSDNISWASNESCQTSQVDCK